MNPISCRAAERRFFVYGGLIVPDDRFDGLGATAAQRVGNQGRSKKRIPSCKGETPVMRIRALLLIPVLATASAVTAHADVAPNWFLMTITGGDSGARNVLTLMSIDGAIMKGPLVSAFGFSDVQDGKVKFSDILMTNFGGGDERVTTTKDLGGTSLTVSSDSGGGDFGSGSSATIGELAPGETVALLIFITSFAATDVAYVPPVVSKGSVTYDFTQGSGSTAVVLGNTADTGPEVTAAGAAVGTETHTDSVSAPIVGGLYSQQICAAVCTATWTAPDATTGTQIDTPALVSGGSTFGGPAGSWAWSFTGAANDAFFVPFENPVPVLAAYAPIGDNWKLFV